ncbi:DUF1570 domain-containing protein [Paludisphaera borealis]|uniref:DUF1570 domain-containing protein n=1 Tax=Paludisphaera borealis TaxID=1387353 RepID=A0A1U7CNZ4_9BACT|nr:DUF1570 domain-containing protein [Paludisphaera borealis]APW60603.1 hypothetical protein BSF38_02078 [Paludisphaera borealis]
MEPMVTTCGGCGTAIRVRSPEIAKRRACPRCRTILETLPPIPAQPSPTARATSPRLACLLTVLALLVVWFGETLITANSSAMERTASAALLIPPSRLYRGPAGDLETPPSNDCSLRRNALTRLIQPLSRGLQVGNRLLPDGRSRIGAARSLAMLIATGPWNLADDVEAARFFVERIGFSPIRVNAEADPHAPRDRAGAVPVLTPPDFGAPSPEALSAACSSKGVPRFSIRGDDGRPVVARLHGHRDGKTVVVLPDGRLGIPSMVVPSVEPFSPISGDEMERRAQTGPFATFQVHRTPHYVILYQSSRPFATNTGKLLEDLYKRLIEAFHKHDVPVHEAEFPLVAVIFRHESDFRAHRPVDADVRAYFEIFSNRIFLFETSEREGVEPEISALLTTQTVAHEGTHQILQNIGVQPRLSAWPLWLVEGLAEYCAAPLSSRKGAPTWDGLGQINSLHMATLRELDDPLSLSMKGPDDRLRSRLRKPGQPMVEAMLRKSDMTPTDYALAWAVTHYLAMKRGPEFTRFLSVMGQTSPLEPKTPDDHVRQFREAFGEDLAKMDKTIDAYLRKLSRQKGYDPMPYYAVMFEQPLPIGIVRHAAMVSQSPQVIQQWVQELSSPGAGMVSWQAIPHPTRDRANQEIQEWMSGY